MPTDKPTIAMTKEEFLALAEQKYADLAELSYTDFYAFEKGFDATWQQLGKQVMQASISKTGKDKRKKTL